MIKNDSPYEKRVQIAVNDYIKIEILGHVVSSGNTRGFWHSHPFWELIYVHKGSGVHHCEDITAEGNPDTLFLIPPQLKHNFENVISFENENLYIGFSCNPNNTLDTVIRNFDYTLEGMPGIELLKMHLREMIGLVKKSEYSNQNIKTGNLIEGLTKVTNYISTFYSSDTNNQNSSNINLVEKVKGYLQNNIFRNINVRELAQMLYLSPHYIGDAFKKNSGLSIKEYHNVLRMEYAFRLLKETDLSISEIAEKIGFESIHYFSRRFKEYYTVSPNLLRKPE